MGTVGECERVIERSVCVTPQVKKKKCCQIFEAHVPHLPLISPSHIHKISLSLFNRPSLPFTLFYFLSFSFLTNTSHSLHHTLPPVPIPYHHLHHHFSGKITGKLYWKKLRHLSLLFKVKIPNLFGGFVCFC